MSSSGRGEVDIISVNSWSGWADLNRRPPEPHSGALPGCATPRIKTA